MLTGQRVVQRITRNLLMFQLRFRNVKADDKTAYVINIDSKACFPNTPKASVNNDNMADTKNSAFESRKKNRKTGCCLSRLFYFIFKTQIFIRS